MSAPQDPYLSDRPAILVADYLRVLYKRRWLAVALFTGVVLAVAIFTYRAVPLYEAHVSVLIDVEEPNVVDIPQVLTDSPTQGSYVQTQEELLISRALVARTVDAMQLWKRPDTGLSTKEEAIGAVGSRLAVTPVRGTRLVNVRVQWRDPKLAAEIANVHARQYVEQSLEKRFNASTQATQWLDAQLGQERKRVEQSEAALQAYREQHDAVSLEKGQDIVVQKLIELNSAVTRAKTNRIEKEAEYRELLAGRNDPLSLSAFPAILSNAFIQELKGTLATSQREYAQLSETLGERHPTLVEKRTAMETTEKRLAAEVDRVVDSVRKSFEAARAEEASMVEALNEQKSEALALNRRGIEYAALEREAESVRQVYQTLLQRAKETGISRDLRGTNINIVDAAEIPRAPVYPRTTMNMLLGLLAGTVMAFGGVFLAELADDRIAAPEDVGALLGQPLLALVPKTRSRGRKRVSLLDHNPSPALVEAFRALRTTVISAIGTGDTPRSILVASAAENEGKTHVATNLAIALAQAQHSVVLIDADMRRPSLHGQFDQPLEPGLADVLAGRATLQEVLRPSSVPGLTVVSAGTLTSEAPELLGSSAFHQFFDILQEHFPWVIVDSPPSLTVTDAIVIAPRTTGVVLVLGCEQTRARAARLAIDALQRSGARIIGAVLNNADVEHHPYYYSSYASQTYLGSLASTTENRRSTASA